MDSPQSAPSSAKPDTDDSGTFPRKISFHGISGVDSDGVLEIYIHEAREIHNICIYQKQDVYAKFCLTNDPDLTVSSNIINGGGHNPIFNQFLRLNVRKLDSSLKCEIWMLSRVRNYLEDQLLGFALIPISDILLQNGKLEKEFSLSSTDLFHSPAGFVQLSISYRGTQPDVIHVPPPPSASVETESLKAHSADLEKIEFPDPKVVNENHQMVEEYLSMPSSTLESANMVNEEINDDKETLSTSSSKPHPKLDSPLGNESTIPEASPDSLPLSSQSSETPKASTDSLPPIIKVDIVEESKVVQQDIVDMYMKSMQQFTESLAKMKLPMEFESGPKSSDNSISDQKSPTSKNSTTSRVFYGSRAFF